MIAVTDFIELVTLTIGNFASEGVLVSVHFIDREHGDHTVRRERFFREGSAIWAADKNRAGAIFLAHDPYIRAIYGIEISPAAWREREEQCHECADFPSCQQVHTAQSKRQLRTLQAANFTMIWKTRRGSFDFAQRARVMGILNVTPDSFSDGGEHCKFTSALNHAMQMIADGAEVIDIGGESTRPGAVAVSEDVEIARTAPVIAALRAVWDGLISIDTTKAAVARAALDAGADIVNDVSGLLGDPDMVEVCKTSGCGVVVMHRQGDPQTMQVAPCYTDVVAEVRAFFEERFATLTAAGLHPDVLCFDPGIGFGKNLNHNLALIRGLERISVHGRLMLLGVSRKFFIGKLLESDDVKSRDWPTVAITSYAREKGVMLHRVHAVKHNSEALRMTEAILGQHD